MYFCPCSCAKPDGDHEDDVLICLPRNLSYAGESYLDRYSVSSAFVHNAKKEKEILKKDVDDHYLKLGSQAAASEELLLGRDDEEEEEGYGEGGEELKPGHKRKKKKHQDCGSESEREELLGALASSNASSTNTTTAIAIAIMAANSDTCSAAASLAGYGRGGGGPADHCDVETVIDTAPTMTLPPSPSMPMASNSSPCRPPLSVNIDKDKPHGHRADPQSDFDRYLRVVESPDSDMVSEEGIFVNMMDDLDGMEGGNGKSTLSEASDDTYVSGDSMYYSPEEVEGMGSGDEELRLSLEEAVNKAASSLRPCDGGDDGHDLSPGSHDDAEAVQSPEEKDNPTRESDPLGVTNFKSLEDVDKESGNASADSDEWADCGFKPEDVEKFKPEGFEQENSGSKPEDTNLNKVVDKSDSTDGGTGSKPAEDSGLLASGAEPKTDAVSGGLQQNPTVDSVLKITINDRPFRSDDRLSASYKDLISPESPLYEDREFNFARSELRKSTSLKSSKTPPGTPRRKKVVRFADAMGLDLESVRHILNLESPPKIPASAMKDLQAGLGEERKAIGTKFIVETFQQPGAEVNFRERVMAQKVCLENALIVSGSITGVVRVANIAYHKTVRVRFTTNDWTTFHDIAASYMLNSNDGSTDRFSFTLVPPLEFGPGSKMECAISFNANGAEFWDNNYGKNYIFECFAKTVPTETENAWMHFL